VSDKWVDEGLKCERNLSLEKNFEMKKNDSAFLPEGVDSVIIGMGWTCNRNFDLDASIVAMDANKNKTFHVNFGTKKGPGVTHRGDNTTGEGSGDDERIRIDFNHVP